MCEITAAHCRKAGHGIPATVRFECEQRCKKKKK
jgi:hypothetical protein